MEEGWLVLKGQFLGSIEGIFMEFNEVLKVPL